MKKTKKTELHVVVKQRVYHTSNKVLQDTYCKHSIALLSRTPWRPQKRFEIMGIFKDIEVGVKFFFSPY